MRKILRRWITTGLRLAVDLVIYVGVRVRWRIEVRGLAYDSRAPHTYLAISHKRDLDSLASVHALVWHRGWSGVAHGVQFALRGDAFTPGFLARVLTRPRWLRQLLRPLTLATLLRRLGIHPLQDLRLRPAEEWIRDAIAVSGDLRANQALSGDFLSRLAAHTGEPLATLCQRPLSQLLTRRYHDATVAYAGPSMLCGESRRAVMRRLVARARHVLQEQASCLWRGEALYSAPEGRLSPDGKLSPVTAGFHRLMQLAPRDTQVVPIFVTYDFMSTGRRRVFVDLAPAILDAPTLARDDLSARLRSAWLLASRFTCTQLASGYLVRLGRMGDTQDGEDGEETGDEQDQQRAHHREAGIFTLEVLAAAVHQQACDLAAAGRHVDQRLLQSSSAYRLCRRYIRFAERHGVLQRAGRQCWRVRPCTLRICVAPGTAGYPRAPLAYAWNELQEMLSAGDPLPSSTVCSGSPALRSVAD